MLKLVAVQEYIYLPNGHQRYATIVPRLPNCHFTNSAGHSNMYKTSIYRGITAITTNRNPIVLVVCLASLRFPAGFGISARIAA